MLSSEDSKIAIFRRQQNAIFRRQQKCYLQEIAKCYLQKITKCYLQTIAKMLSSKDSKMLSSKDSKMLSSKDSKVDSQFSNSQKFLLINNLLMIFMISRGFNGKKIPWSQKYHNLKNHWPKHRLVCIHFDAFATLIPHAGTVTILNTMWVASWLLHQPETSVCINTQINFHLTIRSH